MLLLPQLRLNKKLPLQLQPRQKLNKIPLMLPLLLPLPRQRLIKRLLPLKQRLIKTLLLPPLLKQKENKTPLLLPLP
jgi:hypothetical protein